MVKLFGSTIKESLNVVRASVHAGGQQSNVTSEDKIKVVGRLVITMLLLVGAAYLYTKGNDKQTAATIVGAVTGYWLK